MSETIIDFGGFTVDVSKIDWIDTAAVVPSLFVKIGNTGLWLGDNNAKTLREAREKYLANFARKNLVDGWYWASSTGGTRKLIRVIGGLIEATWGEPTFKPKVTGSQWTDYEPANPMSPEFMHAMRNDGFHPSNWL